MQDYWISRHASIYGFLLSISNDIVVTIVDSILV